MEGVTACEHEELLRRTEPEEEAGWRPDDSAEPLPALALPFQDSPRREVRKCLSVSILTSHVSHCCDYSPLTGTVAGDSGWDLSTGCLALDPVASATPSYTQGRVEG